jgi:monoamine oxidase
MQNESGSQGISRRNLFAMIGMTAGSAAMYQAMTSLGFAAESGYTGPIKLDGDPKGASVLILGAGLAGLTAALELRQAGYKVQILEFNERAGGRNWTLRGGDTYTELGGATQKCEFDTGMYLNPGPWRIPYHHHAVLDYCRRLGVQLEPFQQLNHNELLAKVTQQGKLEGAVSKEDQEILLQALKSWGALDKDYTYKAGHLTSEFRGFRQHPGGGLSAHPSDSEPITFTEVLNSRLWRSLANFSLYEFQTTMFQPVGGMDMIGKAFVKQLSDVIQYNAKVKAIQQDERGVTVTYEDTTKPGSTAQASADWCICTIPLPILSQIEMNVGAPMQAAIRAVPYASSVKVGLQFKRRFWEEDDRIYGGISYTDLPISQISYPSTGYNQGGKGVLLGAYTWNGANSYEFTSMSPAERVKRAVEFGALIHPQYRQEFETGISVAWHRVPFTLGCAGDWTEDTRKEHYENLCQLDGRIVLAGEHASYIPAWMEGAILSSLDAIARLHKRVLAS